MKVESISGTFVLRSFFLYSFTILPFLLFLEITTLNSNKIIKAGDNSNTIELFDKVKQERNRKKKKDIQVFPMIERQQIPSSNKKPKKIERESKANVEKTANSINIKNPWKLDAAIHLIHTECVHHWYYYLREIANFRVFWCCASNVINLYAHFVWMSMYTHFFAFFGILWYVSKTKLRLMATRFLLCDWNKHQTQYEPKIETKEKKPFEWDEMTEK